MRQSAGTLLYRRGPEGLEVLLVHPSGAYNRKAPWSIPKGEPDDEETDLEKTARRETREETGVELAHGDILGTLDDYATRSGYLITPVAVWGGPVSPAMRGAASEVAEIHVIPLADLDVPPRLVRIPESASPVIQLPLLGGWLHAPTAAIVHQFCRVACHGEVLRVTHYEAPVFAWR